MGPGEPTTRSRHEFRLPDLGEGLTEAEVLRWLVAVGDEVTVNQPVVEVETAKASVEIPSPVAGTVAVLGAAEGEMLAVGAPLLTLDAAGREAGDRQAVLVGYGPRAAGPTRRRRTAVPSQAPPEAAAPAPPPPADPPPDAAPTRVLAKPPVRKLARDRGLDLGHIPGSGPGGLVTRADVERASQPAAGNGSGERRIPVRGVRRATAEAMVRSAAVPQAAVNLTVEVSEARRLRARLAAADADAVPDPAVRPTFLALVARAVVLALGERPQLHASWDEAAQEIVVPASVALGIAVAGPRGLLVPKIRACETRSLREIAAEIGRLVRAARDGSIAPGELLNGTFTISNVGVFGVDGGTALVPPGETAILCVGAVRERPWVVDGALAVREVVELTLSIDHRVVDGEEAAHFLADVGSLLHDPGLMLARS
jgi:2-oxoisovalerate dehydrogenase E2 component (dihydrolipoyl transacylase)